MYVNACAYLCKIYIINNRFAYDDTVYPGLDVAAGTGFLTMELASYCQQIQNGKSTILATDFSPEMVRVLQGNIVSKNIKNVEAKVMDGQVQTMCVKHVNNCIEFSFRNNTVF